MDRLLREEKEMSQVVKIVVLLALSVGLLFLASCYGNRVTLEDAAKVNPLDYGDPDGVTDQGEFRLEEFMVACGADYVMFHDDGATIAAKVKDWEITVETYEVKSGLDEPFWCTQVTLQKQNDSMRYILGHAKGVEPRVVSQPERVLVREAASHRPLRQRLEKATFEDLVELMNSGHLLMSEPDPLAGLSFSYLSTDADGTTTIHRPDGSNTPMVGPKTADEVQS